MDLQEYEKVRIQCEQLVEFKSQIMEKQAALQREVQKAKHEAKEAIEAKEAHATEMEELSETVEMLTLDKEMAEERAETMQIELEATKEKMEELTLDLDIIKTEMEGDELQPTSGETGSGVTNFELKQLQAQNEKLRETLVRMRDLSAHEKSESIKLQKEVAMQAAMNIDMPMAKGIVDALEAVDVDIGQRKRRAMALGTRDFTRCRAPKRSAVVHRGQRIRPRQFALVIQEALKRR